ncbi:hypothetical protein ACO0LD_13145 [Undibacterium sp. Ji83W]|uniref:hypothetical protein n=1 Tax=Undibacterium sp. Ji83W TaxID=3413043 RepID=UPI003BF16BEC
MSGFAVLAYLQIQDLRLQIISGLILLAFAICIFMGIKPMKKVTEQGFNISVCLLTAASLSSILPCQASRNSWLMECVLAIIFTNFMQVFLAHPGKQHFLQKNYGLLLTSLQKLLALILIMLATQYLLAGMHAQFSPGLHLP